VKWLEPVSIIGEGDGMDDAIKLGILFGDVLSQFCEFVFPFNITYINVRAGKNPGNALLYF
jgi:hypothetical protein